MVYIRSYSLFITSDLVLVLNVYVCVWVLMLRLLRFFQLLKKQFLIRQFIKIHPLRLRSDLIVAVELVLHLTVRAVRFYQNITRCILCIFMLC